MGLENFKLSYKSKKKKKKEKKKNHLNYII